MTFIAFESPIGIIGIEEKNDEITRLCFGGQALSGTSSPLLNEAVSQLNAYFNNRLKAFDLPYAVHGTDFQNKVWATLTKVPYGTTVSYAELAAMVGNPKACRAVGAANHKNPIPIIIPCHRVIGSNGNLTGYVSGLIIKRKLLNIENKSNRFEAF